MKKYNKINANSILLGIIIPILSFFVVMNFTYAYFSSRANSTLTSGSTSSLIISFSDDTKIYSNSNTVTDSTQLVPGDTLKISGKVENFGNIQAYVLIKFNVTISNAQGTQTETVCEKYYSFSGSTLTEVVQNGSTYSCNAFTINDSSSKDFEVSYKLDFSQIGNEYQNGKASYALKACGVQTSSISNSTEATRMLIEQLNK